MLRRVSYLYKLDRSILDSIFYSLQQINFNPDSLIFEQGALANQVFFIIEGQVNLSANLYDSSLQRRVQVRHRTIAAELKITSDFTLRRSRNRKVTQKDLNSQKLAQVDLTTLQKGSILCATLALFNEELQIHCSALVTTKILTLKKKTLEDLAKSSIQLRMSIQNCKKKYSHYNRLFDNNVVIPPVLDCYRHFEDELEHDIFTWRMKRKFQNTVLMVIMRNRQSTRRRVISYKALVNKLRAIAIANEQGWLELAKKIETSELPPKTIFSAEYLTLEELARPILNQFALLARDAKQAHQESLSRAGHLLDLIEDARGRRRHMELYILELNEIVSCISGFL